MKHLGLLLLGIGLFTASASPGADLLDHTQILEQSCKKLQELGQNALGTHPTSFQRRAYEFVLRLSRSAQHFRRVAEMGPHAYPQLLWPAYRETRENLEWVTASSDDLFPFPPPEPLYTAFMDQLHKIPPQLREIRTLLPH